MDRSDPILGFFHAWTRELAQKFERITVLALRVGDYDLPPNVRVIYLGGNRIKRMTNVVLWSLRLEYDSVLVHMSQEFILTGGWLWKLLGKKIYLWRNHYSGSVLTDIAAAFCTKIFYTSGSSYTMKFKKAVQMPVGVDVDLFASKVSRAPRSALSLGRIAPSKRLEILLDALRDVECSADIYGPADSDYLERLKARAPGFVQFRGSVSNYEAPAVFASHDIFVNISPAGMFDKTILEAAASGCLIVTTSPDAAALFGEKEVKPEPAVIEERVEYLFGLPEEEKQKLRERNRQLARKHSLGELIKKLCAELSA